MTLADRVRAALADDGPLAVAFGGFEPRPGQQQLAGRVADAFEHGRTLIAEAGTGTGKTLAYLLPAVLAGKRVLISTGTRTLQDQIFYKDVPALSAALGTPIKAAYMKGRTNYLCLHRFGRLQEAEAALEDGDRGWLRTIAEWAAETATGDRAEIEDMPDDLPLWQDVTANAEQCLGRDCPRHLDCFVTRMKERAAESDLVIVNHHLLCADASVREGGYGEVIPDCDFAVIDEAHQLEDVVTMYFGVIVGTHRVDEFVRDASHAAGMLPGHEAMAVAAAVSDVQHGFRRLFDAARAGLRAQESEPAHQSGAATRSATVGADRMTLSAQALERIGDAGAHVRSAIGRLESALGAQAGGNDDLTALGTRARALSDDLRVVLTPDPSYVNYVETRGRGMSLRAAPIEVSRIVKTAIVGDRASTVLTSATLAVEGEFGYVRARLGLEDAEAIQLPSEFDFARQAVLYLPPDMPDPRSPEFNRAAAWTIAELLDRTRGRAFALFTSYAAMRDVHQLIARRVSWPLFVQGTAPRTSLLRDFRNTPNAVLLATASFWQGVDVAGDALSCVIIDRLPFASPADPLVSARIKVIQERGGHAFHEYQVPLATLTLLQGLGRLIRTKADRGVLAILDPRLTRMSYGRRFLGSLPPAPITDDLSVVERFLADEDGRGLSLT
ncbi:MAG TPA: ATP-dependent DNA helicase [Vicinamibacterales bacterium]|nr:ATP-dependent DNA helicase [Vicinamibacterales bacterium]